MKCQNMFSGENKKNIPVCRLLNFFTRHVKHLRCLNILGIKVHYINPKYLRRIGLRKQ